MQALLEALDNLTCQCLSRRSGGLDLGPEHQHIKLTQPAAISRRGIKPLKSSDKWAQLQSNEDNVEEKLTLRSDLLLEIRPPPVERHIQFDPDLPPPARQMTQEEDARKTRQDRVLISNSKAQVDKLESTLPPLKQSIMDMENTLKVKQAELRKRIATRTAGVDTVQVLSHICIINACQ